jgi:hypothetical protein
MKTMQTQPFFAALALIAALLAACAPLLDDSAQGNLRIVLGGGARALSPQTIASFSYKLDFSGPGGENFSRTLEQGTRTITLNLALGNWTIGVQAFNSAGLLYGKGEMAVLVGPGNNEAPVSMTFSPVWHAAPWGNDSNPGSEAAPFATVDAALSAVQAAYAAPDWPGKGTANAAPAHIVVSGTIIAGSGISGMVDINDTPSLYYSYPPIILEGTGTLDAGGAANRVLFIHNADVTLGGNLTLTGGFRSYAYGGGVYVGAGGIFTMTGGTISYNSANMLNGGGVAVDGTFTMTGGTISNNSVSGGGGGGVSITGGTFVMTGGTISNNSASGTGGNGGGVEVNTGDFTMTGGTISNNTASGAGGGVSVGSTANFTKTGGAIYGDRKEDAITAETPNLPNTATSGNGHAVMVVSGIKIRNITAGPGIGLSSGSGSANSEPWEP